MATMTFNHSADEARALEQLAKDKDLSKTAVMKQALRLYQLIHERGKLGYTLHLEGDAPGKRKVELVVL
jgi:HD-GYP domain-containing protein (c-di-GMP phosphodiesterase class II)